MGCEEREYLFFMRYLQALQDTAFDLVNLTLAMGNVALYFMCTYAVKYAVVAALFHFGNSFPSTREGGLGDVV